MYFTNIAVPGSFLEKYRDLLSKKLNLRNSVQELQAFIKEVNTQLKIGKGDTGKYAGFKGFEIREKQNSVIIAEMEIAGIQKRIEDIDIKLKEISPNLIEENKTKVNTL